MFLTRLQGNHTGMEKYSETLVSFHILNFYKTNPFYPYKQLVTLSFGNTNSLRIDNPFLCTTKYRLLLSNINGPRTLNESDATSRDGAANPTNLKEVVMALLAQIRLSKCSTKYQPPWSFMFWK